MLKYFLLLAVILRLILMFNPGFEADVSFWKSWGLATYDKGIVEGLKVTNNNYPTPFAYVLGGMVAVYSLFANPHDFNAFWSNTNYLFLFISKLFPVLADFGIAWLLLYIGKNAKKLGFPERKYVYEVFAITYLLNPIALIDGAWWGQVDSMGLFIFFVSLLLVLKKQPFWAGLVYMLSMMTKLQNMIYGPVFFLFIWQFLGYEGLIRSIAGAATGFIGLNIQFFLTGNADRVIGSLTENYDYFPWMSLNAFNLWWIVAGGHGMQVSDKLLSIGIANAKTVGLILFSGFYFFASIRQFLEKRNVIKLFLESLILVNGAFFLFQTQSHDRYAFPLILFLLLWAVFFKKLRPFYVLYGLFTLFYFYNLHTALVTFYPNNGIPFLNFVTQPVVTVSAAYALIGLFFVFLAVLKDRRIIIPAAFVIGALIAINLPLVTKSPISLAKLTPWVKEQSYGTLQINKSVQSSFGGPNSWTRLSDEYVFYRHGLGTHANSRLVYNTNGLFKTFTADYGIDTEAGTKASAVFEIMGDNTLLFKSPVMGRFDLPKHISLNISGVKNLTLITNDAGDGNTDDHTDWLNPQLWP